jgi:hypothetical protein
MMSPRQLQNLGENMTHRQAGGLIYRLLIMPAAFIMVWVSVATIASVLIGAVVGREPTFDITNAHFSILYTLLYYGIGFTGAWVYFRSRFVRRHPFLGCLLGFLSVIPASMIIERIAPALSFFGLG